MSDALSLDSLTPAERDFAIGHCELIATSYERLLGHALVACTGESMLAALWSAEFALLSHGIEDDPLFSFANARALSLFERSFAEIKTLPSRRSSGKVVDEDRIRLLDEVSRKGFIADYSGVRVSASGREFWINDAVVWNLVDEHGNYLGQAAKIAAWRYVD